MLLDVGFEKIATVKRLRGFDDLDATREALHDNILSAVQRTYPMENSAVRLQLDNVALVPPKTDSDAERKHLMAGTTYGNKLVGSWRLTDRNTGKTLDRTKQQILALVPRLTDRGTWILDGVEYAMSNQMRLRSGAYVRKRLDGEVETHINSKPGSGPGLRIWLDSADGVFKLKAGTTNVRLYPVLQGMGIDDKTIGAVWGSELLKKNKTAKAGAELARLQKALKVATPEALWGKLAGIRLDRNVLKRTLGSDTDRLDPDVWLRATARMLAVSSGQDDPDDRNSLVFQRLYGPEDLIPERIEKDAGRIANRLLWRATRDRNLSYARPGIIGSQIRSLFQGSGLVRVVDGTNPFEIADTLHRIVRTGEGGFRDSALIPEEARGLHPSYFSLIDPVRGPENENIGVDLRATLSARKGADGRIWGEYFRTGTTDRVRVPVDDIFDSWIGFPDQDIRGGRLWAISPKTGAIKAKAVAQVPYTLPTGSDMFSFTSSFIPLIGNTRGRRLLMGAKMTTQALPLVEGEAPLVRPLAGNKDAYAEFASRYGGVIRAKSNGIVERVGNGKLIIRHSDGSDAKYTYKAFSPLGRESVMIQTPTVQAGSVVKRGQILATSNFTDKDGVAAIGRNLRAAYLPYYGLDFEDAIVISESAAKKLTSQHSTLEELRLRRGDTTSKSAFVSRLPRIFKPEQLDKLDATGVVKEGTRLESGDPMALVLRQRKIQPTSTARMHGRRTHDWQDRSLTWDKPYPGIVAAVKHRRNSVKFLVRYRAPAQIADKLAGRYGDKGVISAIIPDTHMLRDAEGEPFDILLNPTGVLSRGNPSQIYEALLGKIADKAGEPYLVKHFNQGSYGDFVESELAKAGMSDTEDLHDPVTGDSVNALTGVRYMMKLHHTADTKQSERFLGSYSDEGIPTKGGLASAKRLGIGEVMSLVSHGALDNLRETATIKSQSNPDFWKAVQLGNTPPPPRVPFVFNKFLAYMKGAGIDIRRKGDKFNIMALSSGDVQELTGDREIVAPSSVDGRTLEPIEGGLFDPRLTGGHGGTGWSYIKLPQAMPNPITEKAVTTLLGLTVSEMESILSREKDLNGMTGSEAITKALAGINVNKEYASALSELKRVSTATARDKLIKRLKVLDGFKRTGLKPAELMWDRVPVIPPMFRPISAIRDDLTVVSNPNYLYKELLDLIKARQDLAASVGERGAAEETKAVYRAVKAVTGLGDPVGVKLVNKRVKGLLHDVFGNSPKVGMFQYKLVGSTVDVAGRAAITPNPDLDMDHVGLPENQAWTLYRPFVVRRLVRKGVAPTAAVKSVLARDDKATEALQNEMAYRPALVSRAPSLHRYSVMAAFPVLVKGQTLQVPPIIVPAFNADFDGDAMNFYLPVTEKARKEAIEKMLPSRNLISASNFQPHLVPRHEFQLGLWLGTRNAAGVGKISGKFSIPEDVRAAFRRGEVRPDDVIELRST